MTIAVTELCPGSSGKSGRQVKLTEGGKMGRRHWSWETKTMCLFMRKECEWRVVVLMGRAYESKEVRRGRPWYWQSQQNQRTNDQQASSYLTSTNWKSRLNAGCEERRLYGSYLLVYILIGKKIISMLNISNDTWLCYILKGLGQWKLYLLEQLDSTSSLLIPSNSVFEYACLCMYIYLLRNSALTLLSWSMEMSKVYFFFLDKSK